MLFDESQQEEEPKAEEEERFEEVRPLGEELIDTLIDLLFYVNFTLPRTERSKSKVTYAIWQKGVGCNTLMSSSKELESNRTEILRLLLTLSSKSLYMPARWSDTILLNFNLLTANRHSTCQRGESSYVHHDVSRQAAGTFLALLTA